MVGGEPAEVVRLCENLSSSKDRPESDKNKGTVCSWDMSWGYLLVTPSSRRAVTTHVSPRETSRGRWQSRTARESPAGEFTSAAAGF